MNLRSILNRLTEEELELLQVEIEGDLYDEIERVIGEKQQPSLFTQNYKDGDVFIHMDERGRKIIYRILSQRNPYYYVEYLLSSGIEICYTNYSERRASEVMNWQKVDKSIWDKAKSCYDNQQICRAKQGLEYAHGFEALWDKL